MSKGWDSGMLKKLKSLVGKGLSTSEMGKKLGMSKNAVVGKLTRLGWNTKASEAETEKIAKESKTTSKKQEKCSTEKKIAPKVEKKAVAVKSVKAPSKANKDVKKPVKQVVVKDVKPKVEKKEPVVIKTASKKTKKDMALHELVIQHALQMANLKPNQCRWPIGDPDSDGFHFCGEQVFSGKPYCYEHCRQAYQFTPPKKK